MKVKVKETKEPKEKEQVYPFLGITSAGTIVLFNSKESGMVIKNTAGSEDIGHFDKSNWAMYKFTPFKGKLILSND